MATSSGADDKILSYDDVVLRRSDLDILRRPDFLNDRLIEFYFAHIVASSMSRDRVLLVPPSVAFWLANCPDGALLRESVDPLDLPGQDLVLFPVNNNPDVTEAEGGSHWSLLVFHRPSGEFVHHDSCGGMNRPEARRLFNTLRGFVGAGADASLRFVDGATPQQSNSYDCGLYVMAIAKVVHDWYVGGNGVEGRWFPALEEKVDADAVEKLRGEVLSLILSLMDKKC